ncbi:MAG: hypothetical protein LBE34_12450 [Flavobacteriaceae bacterium]|jgi:hypothetical protein|nr:hypothetical protein [Flavobacteriaceae bacterium]
MNQLNNKLNDIRENGYSLSPFQVMGEAFQYYGKTFFLVLTTLLLAIIGLIFLGSIGLSQIIEIDPNSTQQEIQEKVLELTQLISEPPYFYYYLASFTFLSALSGILIAGYYKLNAEASLNQTPSILSAFKYFFSVKGLYVFISQLLISIVFLCITIPLKMANLEMVSMAINWLANTLTIFTIPLIIFGNQKPLTAIKNSIMVVNKQPIPIVLTVILNYFFLVSGLLFFVIGVLFVLPYLFSVYFTLYKQVIGHNLEE